MKDLRVVIIGAGPAGIGVASGLLKSGVKSITLLERNDRVGGIPSFYKKKKHGVRTFVRWSWGGFPVYGEDFAAWLEQRIAGSTVEVKLNTMVLEINAKSKSLSYVNPQEGRQTIEADVFVLATGAREKNVAERRWIAGSRPARVMYTKQLLNMERNADMLPMKHPLVIGSDVIAYAAAAKLKRSGAEAPVILDNRPSPECPIHERAYFRVFGRFPYRGKVVDTIEIKGTRAAKGVEIDGLHFDVDGVAVTGELVPNSELALMGDLEVQTPSRIPVFSKDARLSEPGWYIAGNSRGGFHGGEWCYFDGRRTARSIVRTNE